MEHWLPLYYETLETVLDQIENFRIVTDHTLEEAARERFNLIEDYYEARKSAGEPGKGKTAQSAPYKPVPPEQLYLSAEHLSAMLAARGAIRITPFAEDELAGRKVMSPDARPGPRWAKAQGTEETGERVNVFELAVKHIADKRAADARSSLPAGRKARSIACCRSWANMAWPASSRSRPFPN